MPAISVVLSIPARRHKVVENPAVGRALRTAGEMATAPVPRVVAWRLFPAKHRIIETIVGYEIVCVRLLQSIDRGGAGRGLCAGIFTWHVRSLSYRRCHTMGLRLFGGAVASCEALVGATKAVSAAMAINEMNVRDFMSCSVRR